MQFPGDQGLTDDFQAMSLRVAEIIASQLRAKPASCLGLPTGRTPLGCYQILSGWSESGQLDWSKVKCFALDEYLDSDDSRSFGTYLQDNLYRHTNLPPESRFNPRFVDDYDALIAASGGLDLAVVGIGRNGHIAFNEPGTPRQSWTHSAWLTDSTRAANAAWFGSIETVPRIAVTMGIATLLSSAEIVLIASGEHKRGILTRASSGPASAGLPASFLWEHSSLRVFTDFQFAGKPG